MSIRTLNRVFYVTSGVLVSLLAIFALLLFLGQRDHERTHTIRYDSYLLADELRQSSDDLTRLARTYVITGDSRFESFYWETLAIRNGELPTPRHYERIYWDLVLGEPGFQINHDGERVSLRTRMERLGFTSLELVKLEEARAANVYWAIGSSATLGTFTTFRGNVIAHTSITMTTEVSTTGRVFALGGAVTMDTNNVDPLPATAPPNVTLTVSVSPTGTVQAQTDLVYTINFSNNGAGPASAFVITDPIPTNTDFKLGSVTTSLGTTGLTATIAYSNNGGATWTYIPVSAAGGAPAGYDRNVTKVRWSFGSNLSQTSPNNAGSVGLTARIR